MSEQLNIVDEQGHILGEASREEIHSKGLLHQEIHVWLVTPNQEIIFQRRAANKDTFPNLLDATVGGHVDLGETFEAAAVREVLEEAGLSLALEDLDVIRTTKTKSHDAVTGMINHALRRVFCYQFAGNVAELAVEQGSATGFEVWHIDQLLTLSDADIKKFTPSMIEDDMLRFYQEIVAAS